MKLENVNSRRPIKIVDDEDIDCLIVLSQQSREFIPIYATSTPRSRNTSHETINIDI